MSVTVIVNHCTSPAGSGGAGIRLQSTLGIVNTGPDVVCENVAAKPYVQSQAMMVPGAVDVLPLNVQLSGGRDHVETAELVPAGASDEH